MCSNDVPESGAYDAAKSRFDDIPLSTRRQSSVQGCLEAILKDYYTVIDPLKDIFVNYWTFLPKNCVYSANFYPAVALWTYAGARTM